MLNTTGQQTAERAIGNTESLVSTAEFHTTQATVEDQKLEQVSLQNIQALLDEFTCESKRRSQLTLLLTRVSTVSTLLLFGLNLFLHRGFPAVNWWSVGSVLTLMTVIPFLTITPIIAFVRPSPKQYAIIDRLIDCNDLRAIDPLFGGLFSKHKATRLMVIKALIALLPKISEGDAERIPLSTRQSLAHVLKYVNSPPPGKYLGDLPVDFVIATLNALQLVGDSSALEIVEALASGVATTDDAKHIKATAMECLEPLRRRGERDRVGQHLLRSSTQPALPMDTRLIPAMEPIDVAASELPRPSAAVDHEG
jgi:hypothetical protein